MGWEPKRRFVIMDLWLGDLTQVSDQPWRSCPEEPKYSGKATKVMIRLKSGEEFFAYCCEDMPGKFIECTTREYVPMEDVKEWNYLKNKD